MDSFGLVGMIGNYEKRKIGRFEADGVIVSTCRVTDSNKPYETAISHLRYNHGKWVVVELYGCSGDAKKGHEKWIKTMISKRLPTRLKDVSTSMIADLSDIMGGDNWRSKEMK